ncbi:MAG: hypothetical protein IJJ47_11280 [Methanosphaera sp.]|nr:hypothetical protein [Methanosphaera sp.]
MPSASIIRSDIPHGPSDERSLRREIQLKRKDPEAKILKELLDAWSGVSPDIWDDLIVECCEKLGGITPVQLIHKAEIYTGTIEDDEREWRERKYGNSKL